MFSKWRLLSDEGDVWTPKCESGVGLKEIEWIPCEEGRRKKGLKITAVNYLEAEDNEARLDYRRISSVWMSKRWEIFTMIKKNVQRKVKRGVRERERCSESKRAGCDLRRRGKKNTFSHRSQIQRWASFHKGWLSPEGIGVCVTPRVAVLRADGWCADTNTITVGPVIYGRVSDALRR